MGSDHSGGKRDIGLFFPKVGRRSGVRPDRAPSPPGIQLAPGPFVDASESQATKFSAPQTIEKPRNRETISRTRNAASRDLRSFATSVDVDVDVDVDKRQVATNDQFATKKQPPAEMAMLITVDGNPVDALEPDDESALSLERGQAEVEGRVLGAEEATARLSRNLLIVAACATGIVWLILLALWIAMTPVQSQSLGPFFLGLAIAFPLAMSWVYKNKRARWLAREPERIAALPAPGTRIRADQRGLTVGDTFAAWGDLRAYAVEMTSMRGRYGRAAYYLRRVFVRGQHIDCAIDISRIGNGRALISEVYRRLCRPVLTRKQRR